MTNPAQPLNMMRAEINVRALHRWMGLRSLADRDHALHCLLTESFSNLAPKPFRAFGTRNSPQMSLYGYGYGDAEELRDAANTFASPEQLDIIPLKSVRSKEMPQEWRTGRILGMEVRIWPTVRIQRDSSRVPAEFLERYRERNIRQGDEYDAYAYHAARLPEGEQMTLSREEVYSQWLADQLDRRGGACLEPGTAKLTAFQRIRAQRKLRRPWRLGPDATIQALIKVTGQDEFNELLRTGVGRERAYGFGMVLVRPPIR